VHQPRSHRDEHDDRQRQGGERPPQTPASGAAPRDRRLPRGEQDDGQAGDTVRDHEPPRPRGTANAATPVNAATASVTSNARFVRRPRTSAAYARPTDHARGSSAAGLESSARARPLESVPTPRRARRDGAGEQHPRHAEERSVCEREVGARRRIAEYAERAAQVRRTRDDRVLHVAVARSRAPTSPRWTWVWDGLAVLLCGSRWVLRVRVRASRPRSPPVGGRQADGGVMIRTGDPARNAAMSSTNCSWNCRYVSTLT
jgi:hypothetical protein